MSATALRLIPLAQLTRWYYDGALPGDLYRAELLRRKRAYAHAKARAMAALS